MSYGAEAWFVSWDSGTFRKWGTRFIVLSSLLAALVGGRGAWAEGLGTDPVAPDAVPGAGVAGTVVVDDGDPGVERDPLAKVTKVPPPPAFSPSYGGTGLELNGAKQNGDGKTSIAVRPKLAAGRYAVWVRFAHKGNPWELNSDRVVVVVHGKEDKHEFACSPRQGGEWVLLGIHELTGNGAALTMSNANVTGVVIFDAAAFVPAGVPARREVRTLPPEGPGFAGIIRRAADIAIGPTDTVVADSLVEQRLRERDFDARLAWDTLLRTADREYLWADTAKGNSILLSRAAGRIASMAAAWAGASEVDGGGMRGNPKLLADTLAALDTFLEQRWSPTTKWDVNWSDYEMGVPRGVLSALCVLGPQASGELKAKALASMAHFTVDPWKFYKKGSLSTGANRVRMVANHIRRAALAEDAKGMERCRDGLPEVLTFVDQDPAKVVKGRDGWWRDGSFIQHGNLPYVGAYGADLVPDIVESISLLEGTAWELKSDDRANIAHWVDNSLLPVAYEGEVFPRTLGRILGYGSDGEEWYQTVVVALCEARPMLSKEQAAAVSARLRRWLDSGSVDPRMGRATFQQFLNLHAIATDPAIKPAGSYTASRTQAAVDLAVHHRPGWAACVAMSSTRVGSYEALNGRNYRGWNQGEGVLMVYPGDPRRYREGFWPLVDPYRLPGITTNTWQLTDHVGFQSAAKPSSQDFVGGASLDDRASVATMHVGREWSSLDARKSWFLLPDAIVCLGSGISAKDGRPCETIVESCRLENADLALAVDGKVVPAGHWKGDLGSAHTVHLAGTTPERAIGWWFPQALKGLAGERGSRTGSRSQMRQNGSTAPITRPWLSLNLSHGVDPQEAMYQYVIMPGASAERLAAMASKPTIEILACTPQTQAVRDTANGFTGAVFHEAGSVGVLAADQPCVVLLGEGKDGYGVSLADPSQKLPRVVLTVNVKLGKLVAADAGVKIVGENPLRIEFDLKGVHGEERTVHWSR